MHQGLLAWFGSAWVAKGVIPRPAGGKGNAVFPQLRERGKASAVGLFDLLTIGEDAAVFGKLNL